MRWKANCKLLSGKNLEGRYGIVKGNVQSLSEKKITKKSYQDNSNGIKIQITCLINMQVENNHYTHMLYK